MKFICKVVFAILFLSCSLIAFGQSHPVDSARYTSTYLDSLDLPGMKETHSNLWRNVDDDDSEYTHDQGLIIGMNTWDISSLTPQQDSIERIVEIHWVFPDSLSAIHYFRRSLLRNSEGARSFDPGPTIGNETHYFLNAGKSIIDTNYVMAHFYCLFHTGRVVTKLFVAQGTDFREFALPRDRIMVLLYKINRRIVDSGM